MVMIYIAGPYRAPTELEVERNVRRAVALGQYAARRGYTPIVPHAMGRMGVYGPDDVPSTHELAIRCGTAVAREVTALWAIQRDDGTLSEGTALEVEAAQRRARIRQQTWDRWCVEAYIDGYPLRLWAGETGPDSSGHEAGLDAG